MLSALAAPPWCVSSASLGTPAVFPLGVMWLAALLGFPCWLLFSEWQAVREALLFLLSSWWSLVLHRGAGDGLLLPGLRVSGGRGRLLSGPFPAVVCPSIGRPGGAGVRRLGL